MADINPHFHQWPLPSSGANEDVISVFEQAVPIDERTKNGAIYTPSYIRDFIINQLSAEDPNKFNNGLIIDPACGCGAFLYTAAQIIRNSDYSFQSIIIPKSHLR